MRAPFLVLMVHSFSLPQFLSLFQRQDKYEDVFKVLFRFILILHLPLKLLLLGSEPALEDASFPKWKGALQHLTSNKRWRVSVDP